MKPTSFNLIPQPNVFDAEQYISVANETSQGLHRPHPSAASQQQRHRWYQQAKQAGLWNLHESFSIATKPTVGIELELYLVDAVTKQPVPVFSQVWEQLPEPIRSHVKKEAFKFQLEIVTGIHETVEQTGDELHECLTAITDVTDRIGVELLWSANLPDFEFDSQMLFVSDRTQSTLRRHPEKISLLHNNGMHVHVGVAKASAIQVCDRMLAISDKIIAMSANSPSSRGGNLQSERANSWMRTFPTVPVDYYRDWSGFYGAMRTLNREGIVLEPKDNYSWSRPTLHQTVEIRTADLPSDLSTALNVADFIHRSVIDCQTAETWAMPSISELRRRCRLAARLGQNYLTCFKDGHPVASANAPTAIECSVTAS